MCQKLLIERLLSFIDVGGLVSPQVRCSGGGVSRRESPLLASRGCRARNSLLINTNEVMRRTIKVILTMLKREAYEIGLRVVSVPDALQRSIPASITRRI
jgi:hypothetical protein